MNFSFFGGFLAENFFLKTCAHYLHPFCLYKAKVGTKHQVVHFVFLREEPPGSSRNFSGFAISPKFGLVDGYSPTGRLSIA
jgi:hypothetical protein